MEATQVLSLNGSVNHDPGAYRKNGKLRSPDGVDVRTAVDFIEPIPEADPSDAAKLLKYILFDPQQPLEVLRRLYIATLQYSPALLQGMTQEEIAGKLFFQGRAAVSLRLKIQQGRAKAKEQTFLGTSRKSPMRPETLQEDERKTEGDSRHD